MKTCSNSNCTQQNPQPIVNFHRDSRKKDGLRCRCKTCELASAKSRREIKSEELRQKQADYYARNGEIQRAASRRWKAEHKDKQREYWQRWYGANHEQRAQYHRDYQAQKPQVILEKSRRRRAMKLAAEGSFTETEFQKKLQEHDYRCSWCGKPLVSGDITRDHYIPLTRGGSDYIENIVPACSSCNCKKRDKLPSEFIGSAILSQAAEGKRFCGKVQRLGSESQQYSAHERPALEMSDDIV